MAERKTKATSKAAEVARAAELLADASRMNRQAGAAVMRDAAREDASLVVPHVDAPVEALDVTEARTRAACLDALTCVVDAQANLCAGALDGAEASLYDENNGAVRLSAMRFFCGYGKASADNAKTVWPLIKEAIRCYHGDAEFQDMLAAVLAFAEGNVGEQVANDLADHMRFDAENGRGILKHRAQQIIDAAVRQVN